MILSKKNMLVFIKGRKVAGTSMEVLLSDICGQDDIITPITPIDEQHRLNNKTRYAQNFGANIEEYTNYINLLKTIPREELGKITPPKGTYYNHMPYVEVINLFGTIADNWSVFAIERCPYRKIISLANFRINIKEYRFSGNTMVSSSQQLKQQIAQIIENKSFVRAKNIGLYKNQDGALVPSILKYENLNQDVDNLMSKLGISVYPKLQHFKKGILSNSLDLYDVFTSEQLRIINEEFHEEFESFGYKMIE